MNKKILVVDDSALMRRVACDIISSDCRFEVADTAKNGLEALELLEKNKYDAVILDVNMPRMNGLELLQALKDKGINNNRVLMFSTQTGEGTRETLEALELGAIDFIQKPKGGFIDVGTDKFKNRFLDILAAVARAPEMHEMKSSSADARYMADSVRQTANKVAQSNLALKRLQTVNNTDIKLRPIQVVHGEKVLAIASSTGGPKALQTLIPMLPGNLNAPVLIVQHMPAGFTKSLAERLDTLSSLSVKEAEEGDRLEKGHVYIAAGGKHMKVGRSGNGYRIYFGDEPNREGVKPSANFMYETLADSDFAQICCVVLTGMGADGTAGIKNLYEKKKLHIIAQNEETCAVYGMPKAIVNTGYVNEVLPLTNIAQAIVNNIGTL